MGMDADETVRRFQAAMADGGPNELAQAIDELAAEDFIQEYPQSGERFLGRALVTRMNQNYESATGTRPRMTLRRTLARGDIVVTEGTIDYGDGIPVSYVGIAELQDGKIAKVTEYFANPFEAPAWRADLSKEMAATRG